MTSLTGYRRHTGKLAVTGDLLKPGYVMRDGNRRGAQVRSGLPGKLFAGNVFQLSTFLTMSTRRCGSNGLTIQPVAPAARPCAFISSPDSVVSTSTGAVL